MKKRKLNVKLPFHRELEVEERLSVHAALRTDVDGVWRMSKAEIAEHFRLRNC